MVNLLIESLQEVSKDYVVYTNHAGSECKHLERIFAYELYRQWANKLGNKCKNPEKLILHGEIVKGFENKTRRYPDFVLHGSQGDYEHQEIVCEIKRKKNLNRKSFIYDLSKIVEFLNSDKTFNHPFNYGVFILIGGYMSDMKYLVKTLPAKISKYSDRILLISHRGKEDFKPAKDVRFLGKLQNEN